jgi:hypothetical protein
MSAPFDADQDGPHCQAERSIDRGQPVRQHGQPLHGVDTAAAFSASALAAASAGAAAATDRQFIPSIPDGLDARTDAAAARVKVARRARQQARLQQAVAARPWTLFAWAPGPRRRWAGLAVLALVAVVVWAEIGFIRTQGDQGEQSGRATLQGGAAARATDTAAASPTPLAALPTPTGPEVSVGMVEANGPVDGCTLHPPLANFRTRIGTNVVGDCVEAPRTVSADEVHQRTTQGEAFWHLADQRMAFTDGSQTWLTAPSGIMRRRNSERFDWEPDAEAGPRPTRSAHVLPPAREGSILPGRRIVSYYGNPLSSSMGILGELTPEELFSRLRTQADAYKAADSTREVVPALELVTVVAQADAGSDGLYKLRMDTDLIEGVAGWADANGFLLILDVQTGLGNVDDEVRWLMPFLKRPNIHLALDPEFSMTAGQVPGKRIGTMDAAAINNVQRTLANLVESEGLPPKLLVVHRFTEDMVTNVPQIATDPRVQVVMVMDGFGGPGIKARQYDELVVQPRAGYTGFKLFYRHDEPLMTPEQVLILDPPPDLIIYQ